MTANHSLQKRNKMFYKFIDSVYYRQLTLYQTLGIAPLLIFSTKLSDGFTLSLSVTIMLIFSNVIVSLMKRVIPQKFHLVSYAAIDTCIILICQCILTAFIPDLAYRLYAIVPFLISNSLVFYRAEAYASQRNCISSAYDGLCVGIGFIILTCIVSSVREVLGLGTLGGIRVIGVNWNFGFAAVPSGGFIILGAIAALIVFIKEKTDKGR